jgi:hypothetical protein
MPARNSRRCIDALWMTGEVCVDAGDTISAMDAQPRPSAPLDPSEYTLSVEETAERYARAGHARTIRRIQKYCARGDLDCVKVETNSGERYLIAPTSIDRHIAQIADALVAAGRDPARPSAPERPLDSGQILQPREDAPPDAPARPSASEATFQNRYKEHLEKENAFLREQNTVLLERVKETNILTGRLQEMLSPLLGSSERKGDSTSTPYKDLSESSAPQP